MNRTVPEDRGAARVASLSFPTLARIVLVALVSIATSGPARASADVPPSPSDLKRVRYQWLERETVSHGFLTLPSDGGRAALRLFSERLDQYYTVYIELDDILDVQSVDREEAATQVALWEERRIAADRKRDEEKARRRAELERSRARERELDRPRPKSDESSGRRVRVTRPDADELVAVMNEDIGDIREALDALRTTNVASVARLSKVVDRDRTYRPARQLLGELEDIGAVLDEIEVGFEKIVESKQRFEDGVASGDIRKRDLDDSAQMVFRRIALYSDRAREAKASQAVFLADVDETIEAAELHLRELAATAEREAKQAAVRAEQRSPSAARSDAASISARVPRDFSYLDAMRVDEPEPEAEAPIVESTNPDDGVSVPAPSVPEDATDDGSGETPEATERSTASATSNMAVAVLTLGGLLLGIFFLATRHRAPQIGGGVSSQQP
ncbi:MAG: hypothetical protein KDC38_20805 [Planctomycetes bacterium]|nr:hypothetical protein [Planctomycetota bacterium]